MTGGARGEMEGRGRVRLAVGLAFAGLALAGLASGAGAQEERPDSFRAGDVLVALAGGRVEWWDGEGRFVAALSTGGSGQLGGMAFAGDGTLYVAHFGETTVTRLSPDGPLGPFGEGYSGSPESIAVDAGGNVYVGQAEGTRDVLKLDPSGRLLTSLDVQTEARGSDWIDLAADQCSLLYTSEGTTVFRYDVCRGEQLEPFATGLPGSFAYALRAFPDGGALVADDEFILRLDGSGRELRRYDAPGQDDWFALNLDPDGRSFWSAGLGSGDVYKFDLGSGRVVLRFSVQDPAPSIGGLAVNGEITAARSGGPSFTSSLPDPGDLSLDPVVVIANAALAAGLVLLMPFPAELFNSTLEAHYDEIVGWFRRRRDRPLARVLAWRPDLTPGRLFLAVTAVAALLYSFLDPTFGISLDSLALYLGILAGLVLTTLAFDAATVGYLAARGRDPGGWRVYPASLPIAVLCVVVSRLARFQPGYLYGVLAGHAVGEELTPEEEGRMATVRSTWVLALVLAAWLVRVPIHGDVERGAGFFPTVLDGMLAAIVVAGLEGLVFGLIPIRYLDGEPLFRWNRRVWAALYGAGAFGFVYVLLNPQSGYLARASTLAAGVLLAAFGLGSVAFWAAFRFRRPAVGAGGAEAPAVEAPSAEPTEPAPPAP